MGQGCSSTVEISLERAVSEAFMSWTTAASGSREDLAKPHARQKTGKIPIWELMKPANVNATLKQVTVSGVDRRFKNLHEEFQFIVRWLKRRGFGKIYLANMTRVGIDIPVVKAVVPGLEVPQYMMGEGRKISISDDLKKLRNSFFDIPQA